MVPLLALGDDVDEQIGFVAPEWEETELFDDQELRSKDGTVEVFPDLTARHAPQPAARTGRRAAQQRADPRLALTAAALRAVASAASK